MHSPLVACVGWGSALIAFWISTTNLAFAGSAFRAVSICSMDGSFLPILRRCSPSPALPADTFLLRPAESEPASAGLALGVAGLALGLALGPPLGAALGLVFSLAFAFALALAFVLLGLAIFASLEALGPGLDLGFPRLPSLLAAASPSSAGSLGSSGACS